MNTFARYTTLLCLLSGLSGTLPASSSDITFKQECPPVSAPWGGYVSSLAESMSSPVYSFINELSWQLKAFATYCGFSILNYYMHAPQSRPSALKVSFVLGATGLTTETEVSVISGFVLSEDTVTLNKVSLTYSALAHLVPSAVVAGESTINIMRSRPGYCPRLIKSAVVTTGVINLLMQIPAIGQSQGAVNMIKRRTALRLVSDLNAMGIELSVCSPAPTKNNLIMFSSMQKRNETALLKQVYPEFNPCLDTTGFDKDKKEACKHSVKVTNLYSKEVRSGKTTLKNKGSGMVLELISEADHLTYEQVEKAIHYPNDAFFEASTYVADYSRPQAVSQDKFQYFLTVSGSDRQYLVFGLQMNSEGDENSLWGWVQFHLLAAGQINYYPHIAMVAEVQHEMEYPDLNKVVQSFFEDANRRALLFEIKDPGIAQEAELTATSPFMDEDAHTEF